MSVNIHPTAIISDKAQLGKDVTVEPFAIIHDDVQINDGTLIKASSYIDNGARIGKNCKIGPQAIVSPASQDLKYRGEECLTLIGNNTTVREFATVHRGTTATGQTQIGDDCLIMAYCHVAHDCILGNHVIMSNLAQIAGHVEVGDWSILSGMCLVIQFIKIGDHVMVGATAKVSKDIGHYSLVGSREPTKFDSINSVGLARRGFSKETIKEIDNFYKLILKSKYNTSDGIQQYLAMNNGKMIPEVQHAINFINNSERGIYR